MSAPIRPEFAARSSQDLLAERREWVREMRQVHDDTAIATISYEIAVLDEELARRRGEVSP